MASCLLDNRRSPHGQLNPIPALFENRRVQFFLQRLDREAQRRLSHNGLFSGTTNVPFLRHRDHLRL